MLHIFKHAYVKIKIVSVKMFGFFGCWRYAVLFVDFVVVVVVVVVVVYNVANLVILGCSWGTYGYNCNETCQSNCSGNSSCDAITGICPQVIKPIIFLLSVLVVFRCVLTVDIDCVEIFCWLFFKYKSIFDTMII